MLSAEELMLLNCGVGEDLRVSCTAAAAAESLQSCLSLGFSRQEHWSGLPFPSPMHESEK